MARLRDFREDNPPYLGRINRDPHRRRKLAEVFVREVIGLLILPSRDPNQIEYRILGS